MANSLLDLNVSVEYAEAARALKNDQERLQRNKRPAMAAAVGQLHRYVIGIVPVDTGRLKNSIFAEVQNGGDRGLLGTNVYYAIYQEYGTRYISPRRFMGRTSQTEGPAAIRTYKSILLQG